MSWRLFPHTADVGAEVEAPDLPALFAEAALALRHLLVEEGEVRPAVERTVEVGGADLPELLVNWLTELIFLVETEGLVFGDFSFETLGEGRLSATARGEPLDEARHALGREVKAVTYHEIEVEPTPEGWRARVLFDL